MIILKILPKNSNILAMTLYPFVLARRGRELSKRIINHEKIHLRQQLEVTLVALVLFFGVFMFTINWYSLLIIPLFYYLYIGEWLVRVLLKKGDPYYDLSFEQEAFLNESDENYLENRKGFAWLKYVRKRF